MPSAGRVLAICRHCREVITVRTRVSSNLIALVFPEVETGFSATLPESRDAPGQMPLHGAPESDWKVFRELQQLALERFCQRTLAEVDAISNRSSATHHQRYLEIYRLLRERDAELARAFDNPRRSDMMRQLATIYSYRLIGTAEFERFSQATRDTIGALLGESRR